MPVSRTLTARALAQTVKHVDYWLEDNADYTSVALENGSLWVNDFDGTLPQMRRAVKEEFVKRGWVCRSVKGVKTLIKVS